MMNLHPVLGEKEKVLFSIVQHSEPTDVTRKTMGFELKSLCSSLIFIIMSILTNPNFS